MSYEHLETRRRCTPYYGGRRLYFCSFCMVMQRQEFRQTGFGSGSPQEDGPVDIVAIKKQVQANSMHESRFGKRKSFTNETTKALSERTIPALNMRCFACFLAHLC